MNNKPNFNNSVVLHSLSSMYCCRLPRNVQVIEICPQEFVKPLNISSVLTPQLTSSISKGLGDSLRKSKDILIICDDATRPTPTAKILPVLSNFLTNIGITQKHQAVLFATGSHRKLSEKEVISKLGLVYKNISWSCHDWQKDDIINLGKTPSGIPIEVNSKIMQYESIIGIGSVFPHRYCGWSGGGKIIIPGISSPASLSKTHWLPYYDKSIYLGSINNSALKEIMLAAKIAKLTALIQVVCNAKGEVKDVIFNTPQEAHLEAINIAKSTMSAQIMDKVDIVIAQAWPEDSDLWQTGKALYPAENIIKSNGHIIIVADMPEGIGPHTLYAELINKSIDEILSYKDCRDERSLAAAAAFLTYVVSKKAHISIVTNSRHSSLIAQKTGFNVYNSLQEAVDPLCNNHRKLSCAILYEAPLLLPFVEDDKC